MYSGRVDLLFDAADDALAADGACEKRGKIRTYIHKL